jgi:UDP-N-acetylglucosamine 2-epimerase
MSVASTRYVVTAYHEVIRALESDGVMVTHIGLANDLWRDGAARNAYGSFGYRVHTVPRPSGAASSQWRTPGVWQELQDALPAILSSVSRLIEEYRPDVFLIPDDDGPLDVALISAFTQRGIPVVYLEHGPGYAFDLEKTFRFRMATAVRRVSGTLRNRARSVSVFGRSPGRRGPVLASSLPLVRPTGHNGPYTICSYCGLTRDILIKHGVSPSTIRQTGFPYFDRVVRSRTDAENSHDCARRLLVVSSGNIIYAQDDDARGFYEFADRAIRNLVQDFEVSIRFKPGEERHPLTSQFMDRMTQLNVSVDDNSIASFDAVRRYALVMGETSTVLQEASILGISIVVWDFDRAPSRSLTLSSVLAKHLGVLTLSNAGMARQIVVRAMSEGYRDSLARRLAESGRYVYDNDGAAGRRVAQVILELATSRRAAGGTDAAG